MTYANALEMLTALRDTEVPAVESDLAAHEALAQAHGITAFGASLVNDATAAAARATLELDTYYEARGRSDAMVLMLMGA